MRSFSRESGTNQRSALVVRSVRGARWFFLSRTSAGDFFVSRGRKTEELLLFSRTVRAFLTELQTEDCFSTPSGVKSQSFACTSRWLPYRGEFYFICGGRSDSRRAWRMTVIYGLSVACSTPRQHVASKSFCDCICFKMGNEVSFRGTNIFFREKVSSPRSRGRSSSPETSSAQQMRKRSACARRRKTLQVVI